MLDRTGVFVFAAISGAVLLAGLPADAKAKAASDNAPRYVLHETSKGLVRLDTQSGQISVCDDPKGELVCRLAPDDRRAYETQIDALIAENDTLRDQLANAALTGGQQSKKKPKITDELPSREEVDEAIGFFEYFIDRLMKTAKDLGSDLGADLSQDHSSTDN